MTKELKYIEIRSEPFTKEELVEIGYYADVMGLVHAYYSTKDRADRYNAFCDCPELVIYLEDFYDNVLGYYKTTSQDI